MRLLSELRANLTAWRLARRLPQIMRAGWGKSELYTIGQIRAGLATARVSGPYAVIAYAAYLDEASFDDFTNGEAIIGYEAARRKYFQSIPWSAASPYAFEPITNDSAAGQVGPLSH